MTKIKSTKRALFMSGLALLVCISMLVGSTFAWFTDSVASKNNKIVAGKLDIKLNMWTAADTKVEITNETAPLFGSTSGIAQNNAADTLWEPGKTQVVYLSIENAGNLDLKYKVAIDVRDTDGEQDLYEVMQYAITPNARFDSVKTWANGIDVVPGVNATGSNNVELKKGEEHFFALSVHMDEDAGNEYMNGQVDFDIRVLAAQLASELDSFGNTYDKLATYKEGEYLVSAEEFAVNGTAGQTVVATNTEETVKVTAVAGSTGEVKTSIKPANASTAVFEAVGNSGKSLVSYDINVSGQQDGSLVALDIFLGKNLTDVVAYHEGVQMAAADYSYNASTGIVTIKTTSFSPFDFAFNYASDVPLAKVTALDIKEVNATLGMGGEVGKYNLDIGYLFEMMQTAEEAAASPYAKYHADFVLTVDKEVAANAVALLGYYEYYCENYNDGNWVALVSDAAVAADEEIRLVSYLLNGGSVNYEELGEFVEAFRCGVSKLDDSVIGTTLTVELRLYEVKDPADTANNTYNEETGEYVTVCTYNHTF